MNRNMLKALLSFIVLIGGIAAYFYWQHTEPEVAVKVTPPPIPSAPKPEVRQVIEAPPPASPLPALAESDQYLFDALSGLVANQSLMQLFISERIIRNIVVTIDNLPRMKLPLRLLPVQPAAGKFMTAESGGKLSISPRNASRYAPYMKIAEAMDSKQLVALYVRLYPLFQQAYEDLGYPGKYFNDRLIEALDDLLDAPDIREPVRLARPNVLYLYADPELEGLSIGQRILMRIGSRNEAAMKARLLAIRQELSLHMHENRIGTAGQ